MYYDTGQLFFMGITILGLGSMIIFVIYEFSRDIWRWIKDAN